MIFSINENYWLKRTFGILFVFYEVLILLF